MILTFIEHDRGAMNPVCLETLTSGRGLAAGSGVSLQAVLIGSRSLALRDALQRYGVSRIHLAEHPALEDYAPEAWAKSIAQLIGSVRPHVVLAAATERGNEILARVGALASLPMAANCVEVNAGSPFRVLRYRWGSSLLEEAHVHGDPKLITIAPHLIDPCESETRTEASVESFSPTLEQKDLRVRVCAREDTASEGVNLKTAAVVVGGGRGVGSTEGFHLLEELAGLLGGAVGGSRVVTNNGWRPHSDQIGLTGNRIAPHLYIACGISGAIQHLVGCKGARHVLVINKDREAPFFRRADYGVVGDLHEILPALIEAIRKKKTQATFRAPCRRK
jgi:electron transfer flavoprotein alpha subunit